MTAPPTELRSACRTSYTEDQTVPYLTVPQAAEHLNTSVRFVRRLIAERRITFFRVGRHVRFAVADLDAFVQAGRVEPVTAASVWRDLGGVA
ncbi:excisionase family DNA binding protein [Pseudonocardia autotrophica]|uniref:Helix-turn-helix domain protein n=2 Tax=Pseudonocardia TaxID=1847 RepID=A0A1Y2MS33_PSEAH|nr:Helix-turn-helix domain protein [Pseudonocardia autotrophica]TDN74681.1 excisionase family DNA binding protein [Pseudonocardia autotrophica]